MCILAGDKPFDVHTGANLMKSIPDTNVKTCNLVSNLKNSSDQPYDEHTGANLMSMPDTNVKTCNLVSHLKNSSDQPYDVHTGDKP